MALKPDRDLHLVDDISWFMNEVATRGGVASISTAGSGIALDQSVNLVTYAAEPSGVTPVGILMGDMVNIDQTRNHINDHKDEVQQGGKVRLVRKGWVTTNSITGTPTAGGTAYLGPSGNFVTDNPTANHPIVGQFQGTLDEDGYAKVYVDLPGGGLS
jgi:hypothetical protein